MDWRSTLRADLARLAPGEHLSVITLTLFRLSQSLSDPGVGRLRRLALLPVLAVKFVWIDLLMGAQFPRAAQIGPGLRLPHGGRGVCIHPFARIGRDATIFQSVGIGAIEEVDDHGRALPVALVVPELGDEVYIGTGALIFGPIHIGDRARIGTGAVVFRDVPADATVLPAPGRIMVRAQPEPEPEPDGASGS